MMRMTRQKRYRIPYTICSSNLMDFDAHLRHHHYYLLSYLIYLNIEEQKDSPIFYE